MRALKVKVERETSKNIVIKMLAVNRSFPVRKETFQKRVDNGLYQIVK